ncbi:hypothetical protein [Thiocapsa sp. UBA6158]|jgi:hypothetical protein|uniref:hypothetical protein n=1 Tax=Thiocapsa sp. UBA6158 TaxID=1947692 RepID=UPI0025EB9539|nr:hypothetical protein [Thiocapsa sp. UBA6158]
MRFPYGLSDFGNELLLKTAFLVFLFNNRLSMMVSELETERASVDLALCLVWRAVDVPVRR